MEDLSRFTGPTGGSSRLAAYRARLDGSTPAQAGLAAALARTDCHPAPLAARTVPTPRTVAPAKPKATTGITGDRVKIVANAVANDPALAGKAGDAINFLADPAFAGVTGQGIVKLLNAGATGTPPALASASNFTKPTSTATSPDVWAGAIARMGKPAALGASKASMAPWEKVIGRMNRDNGFH